jgi:hypothetical protein
MIAMLLVGELIGYAIASRQTELSSRSKAAEVTRTPAVGEPTVAAEPCVSVQWDGHFFELQ